MAIKRVSLKALRERKGEILRDIKPVSDEDIDFSDSPELDFNHIDWDTVQVCPPVGKERITIRIDSDVLSWFRTRGGKYQKLINSVLRSYYEANIEKSKKPKKTDLP